MKLYAIKNVETGKLVSTPDDVVFTTDDIGIAQRFARSRMRNRCEICIIVELEDSDKDC